MTTNHLSTRRRWDWTPFIFPNTGVQVRSVIDEMCTSELCRPDLDLTAHINKLFPTEQSLSQLDSVMQNIEKEIEELDIELADLVEQHGQAAADGTSALAEVHSPSFAVSKDNLMGEHFVVSGTYRNGRAGATDSAHPRKDAVLRNERSRNDEGHKAAGRGKTEPDRLHHYASPPPSSLDGCQFSK